MKFVYNNQLALLNEKCSTKRFINYISSQEIKSKSDFKSRNILYLLELTQSE
jgi:hypothetical protein